MRLVRKHNWTLYQNGPFNDFRWFVVQLINPFNWSKIKWHWIKWSIIVNSPFYKSPKEKFDEFMTENKSKISWFKEYGYIKTHNHEHRKNN